MEMGLRAVSAPMSPACTLTIQPIPAVEPRAATPPKAVRQRKNRALPLGRSVGIDGWRRLWALRRHKGLVVLVSPSGTRVGQDRASPYKEPGMQTLRDALEQSETSGAAIGHFNVADLVLLKAVAAAGRELKVPVAVGASEGEREFLGVRQIAALVRSLREEFDAPIFLNADHTPFAGACARHRQSGLRLRRLRPLRAAVRRERPPDERGG
jgi:hypothetical protein